jgi:hypothetical protein
VEAEAEAEVAGVVVVVVVGVVVGVEVGDGAGAVPFGAAGGKMVSAGVAGSAHSLEQALNSAPLSGAFCFPCLRKKSGAQP